MAVSSYTAGATIGTRRVIYYYCVVAYCAVGNADCAVDIVVMSTSVARSDAETPHTVRAVWVAAFSAGPDALRDLSGGLTVNDYSIPNDRFAVFTVEYSASQRLISVHTGIAAGAGGVAIAAVAADVAHPLQSIGIPDYAVLYYRLAVGPKVHRTPVGFTTVVGITAREAAVGVGAESVAASAATSAESGGANNLTVPKGRAAVGIEVYGPTKTAAARITMTAGSGIALVSVYTIVAIPSLGRAISDNAIRDKGAALTKTGYRSAEDIDVIAPKRVEDEDIVATAIYNSETLNGGVGGLFTTLEDKSIPEFPTIDNCVSNIARVVRTFADNGN